MKQALLSPKDSFYKKDNQADDYSEKTKKETEKILETLNTFSIKNLLKYLERNLQLLKKYCKDEREIFFLENFINEHKNLPGEKFIKNNYLAVITNKLNKIMLEITWNNNDKKIDSEIKNIKKEIFGKIKELYFSLNYKVDYKSVGRDIFVLENKKYLNASEISKLISLKIYIALGEEVHKKEFFE